MNKPLRRIAIFCGLLMLALLLRDNWLQYAQADSLAKDSDNRRVRIERYSIPRGDIIVDGKAITDSKETDGEFQYKRTWKNGPMWAPVTGYSSQAFDSNALEKIEDGILTGNDDRLFFRNTLDMLTGKERQGGNVVTTLSSAAQKAAWNGLKGKKGAAVALDPATGKILAMVSAPSYDPGKFAGSMDSDAKAWNSLQKKNNPDDPMLNRALRQTYPPGSTFKVVTAAAALEEGLIDDIDASTDSPDPFPLPQSTTKLTNDHGVCKDVSLREALRISCNTVFGKISDELGNKTMIEHADKFGFNEEVFTPVRADASIYPKDVPPQNAMAGSGQAPNRPPPLQMAMVAAAVANDGKLMKPYSVAQLRSANLDVIEETEPEELSQAVSPENAQKLQEMMETVVKDGTGQTAQIPGVTVGGKTGTAQHGENNEKNPYAWFISYAKDSNGKSVAVAVVVEDGSAVREDISGGGLAAPIAKDIMKAVLNK
ncbi:penicillin-binding transpeptidase domain-containing protein [Streptomyces fragilis]|uniref:penicillin-binding transpeptidase domain-containing protein n=1 Tax=Streptomyces fragilis TaxID=67301 RepID=UPI0024DEE0C8|nr:penicillin-binding transpeptidase domain-containing protein [Streptomyces fragilis]